VEHLENPGEFLEKAKRLLKPGGYVAISVPHLRNFEFMKINDKPPRHLTRWNEEAMKNYLDQHGFSVVRSKAIPATIPFLITKFHFWFKGIFSFNLVQKVFRKTNIVSERSRGVSWKLKFFQILARTKDYILFSLPALFLWLFLLLSGRRLGLYVLAKKF
jgi:SAM-dependent methyltransferase